MTQYVVIATPAYDGKLTDGCAKSISDARILCIRAGIWTDFLTLGGCAYLPMARNKLVRDFLANSKATDLVFIDADVGFSARSLVRLLGHDVDVVAGAYRYKVDEERYPVLPLAADGHEGEATAPPRVDEATGLITAGMVPSGFLRIRRAVFERFLEHYGAPNLAVVERNRDGTERERYYDFFDTQKVGEQWFGEDVRFGQLWQAMGGELWIDPDLDLTHTGVKHYPGNYHRFLLRQPGGSEGPALEPQFHLAQAPETNDGALAQRLTANLSAPQKQELGRRVLAIGKVDTRALPTGADLVPQGGAGPVMQTAEQPAPRVPRYEQPPETSAPGMDEGPELLLGCGASRYKSLVRPGGDVEWHNLVTLDINPAHEPDVLHDLESLPYPFEADTFSEIHAYEVLEHTGRQGDWQFFFQQFSELWRILKPGGWLIGSVPAWDSEFAFGDPSHSRVLPSPVFAYLCQEEYRKQIGKTMMADFRPFYQADFRVHLLQMDKENLVLSHDGRSIERRNPENGRFMRFLLQAIKPSTYREADLALVLERERARQTEYEHAKRMWHAKQQPQGAA